MIVGLLVRHFKCYRNINFIPILKDFTDKYSVFVGENGVGKSAIFEALNVYFNDGEWNITKEADKNKAYIVPVFLLKKTDFRIKKLESFKLIKSISTYFYSVLEEEKNIDKTYALNIFFRFRDDIKKVYSEEYFMLPLGINHSNQSNIYFGSTFDKECKEILGEEGYSNLDFNILKKEILDLYNYVYIPVEEDINNILRAEGSDMQALMDKNLVKEIEETLDQKVKIDNIGREKKIIDYINEQLTSLLEEINLSLNHIDKSYKYTSKTNNKKNLTSNDIKEKIIEAYFSIQELRKDEKPINRLSSGEKRKAMIDTVSAFLSNNNYEERYQKIILAIDEPEISMHVSSCFDQFISLQNLSYKYNHQILLTTHWYGFIPISNKGSMFNISKIEDNKRVIDGFNLQNIVESTIKQRKTELIPSLLDFKSIFDLASSMVSYISSNTKIRWIICEGFTDKKYLDSIIDNNNFKITNVGGIGNVRKLYYHMYLPLLDKKQKIDDDNNKIMFLVDSDSQVLDFSNPSIGSKNARGMKNILKLIILQNGKDDLILEDRVRKNSIAVQTEIEDCLNPKLYYDSVFDILPEYKESFQFNTEAKTSKISGDSSILLAVDESYHEKKRELKAKLDKNEYKIKICNKYIELAKKDSHSHVLKDKILDVFNN